MFIKTVALYFAFIIVFANSVFAQTLPVISKTQKINGEELKTLVKNPNNKQPVLINFWATWCGPCRAEFPDLVKIDADYRKRNLKFIVVSVDDFADIDTRVPEFLKSYESTMSSYLIDLDTRREIAKAIRQFAPTFRDVYPTTLLFDERGRLVFQKAGKVEAKILRAQIDKLLPKSKN